MIYYSYNESKILDYSYWMCINFWRLDRQFVYYSGKQGAYYTQQAHAQDEAAGVFQVRRGAIYMTDKTIPLYQWC
jgi:hypothetical protein